MSFEARLTSAGFLGEIDVALGAGCVYLTGPRAPLAPLRIRLAGQWALVVAGVLIVLLGQDWGIGFVFAAPVFSFAAYLWLWWIAKDETVAVELGAQTEAATGWASQWYDFLWLANFLYAMAVATTSSKMVSFMGPAHAGGSHRAKYIVQASDPGAAAALTATLLGLGGQPSGLARTEDSRD